MDEPVPALTAKAAILLSLVEGPAHGGAVAKRAIDRSRGGVIVPDGTLYPVLATLAEDGFVKERKGSPRSRTFELTAKGLRAAHTIASTLRVMAAAVPLPGPVAAVPPVSPPAIAPRNLRPVVPGPRPKARIPAPVSPPSPAPLRPRRVSYDPRPAVVRPPSPRMVELDPVPVDDALDAIPPPLPAGDGAEVSGSTFVELDPVPAAGDEEDLDQRPRRR